MAVGIILMSNESPNLKIIPQNYFRNYFSKERAINILTCSQEEKRIIEQEK